MSDVHSKELDKLLNFLEGESDYDSKWFGDHIAAIDGGSFWWRRHLRVTIEAHITKAVLDARVEEIENFIATDILGTLNRLSNTVAVVDKRINKLKGEQLLLEKPDRIQSLNETKENS